MLFLFVLHSTMICDCRGLKKNIIIFINNEEFTTYNNLLGLIGHNDERHTLNDEIH